jgi:predicted transcriptional regulator
MSSLNRKGFIEKSHSKDHLYFYYETTDGARTDISTKISHSSTKAVSDSLIVEMAKQCRVKKSDFVELIRCSLDQAGYEQILKRKDLI